MVIRKGSSLPAWLWMSRARRQIAQHLEKGELGGSTISSSPPPRVHPIHPGETYFQSARDQVALQAPYPMGPSMALPPGHAMARRHPDGTPLLVYRDKKDPSQIRAFVNACRHRGSPLLNTSHQNKFVTTALKAPLLTCPYHAWTYDATNGALRKIPGHEKAFGLLDTSELGLTVLTCTEQAGMIWIGGDTLREEGLWQMDEMHSTLEPLLHDPAATTTDASLFTNVIGYREWNSLQANWQILVETALETYHVPALHKKTFHLVTDPTEGTMVSEWKDGNLNATMTVPLRNFGRSDASANSSNNNVDDIWTREDTIRFLEETTTTHSLFPFSLVTFFKRFVVFTVMEPVLPPPNSNTKNDKDTNPPPPSTSTIIRVWALPHPLYDPATEEDGEGLQQRDFQGVLAAVEEDWHCSEQIQEGLTRRVGGGVDATSKGVDAKEFLYGGFEGNNVQFLNNVGTIAKQLEEIRKRNC